MEVKPQSVGLVVEAPADERTVHLLLDRVLVGAREWLDDCTLDGVRRWRGVDPDTPVTLWKKVRSLAREHGVRKHGHFGGEPGAPDALAARRALLLFQRFGMPEAVVLLRDADDQTERLRGLTQARDESPSSARIAVGVANPEREAWIISGFHPENDAELQALSGERARLGFDPTIASEQLGGEGKRSAKQALRNLCHGDRDREERCVTELSRLHEHGHANGLAPFLDELDERVVPALA